MFYFFGTQRLVKKLSFRCVALLYAISLSGGVLVLSALY